MPVNNATIQGDPHFVGADGGRYDVQGKAGKTYNILSDKDLQVNAKFQAYGGGGATTMGEIGVTMGQDQVQIDKAGKVTINGEAMEGNSALDGAITKSGKVVTVKSGEYQIKITSAGGYLNAAFNSDNVAADGVMPHGVWGQAADGDGKARNGDKGAGAQGGGAIEGLDGEISKKGDKTTVQQYEVNGIFDTDFANFNRFTGSFTNEAVVPAAANGLAVE